MEILIINGSPRRQGLVAQMLDVMRDEAASHVGVHVSVVRAIDLQVRPCTGCMECRRTGRCHACSPADDSLKVLDLMRRADAVVCGAPCYWGNMPGHLKVLFDRMVYGMMADGGTFPVPLMTGKRCILLSTCTTPWPWNILFRQSRGTIRALREIFHYAGFRITGVIEKGGTKAHPQLTDREAQRCRRAVRRLIRKGRG